MSRIGKYYRENFHAGRLRSLVSETGIPLRYLPHILEVSSEESLAWWSKRLKLPVSETEFQRLESLISIDDDLLISGNYDVALARRRAMGDVAALPERYATNPNSYLRTSYHIYKYLVLTRGQHFADQILYRMNVSPRIYENLATKVNLTYFVDLLDQLSLAGLSKVEMDSLSSVMFLTMHETQIGRIVGQAESAHDVYRLLSQSFEFFDTNFDYRSHFHGKKYILETVLPLSHHQDISQNAEGMQRLMRYRQILLAWFPYLAGMNPLYPATEFEIQTDRLVTRYEINLEREPKPLARIRLV